MFDVRMPGLLRAWEDARSIGVRGPLGRDSAKLHICLPHISVSGCALRCSVKRAIAPNYVHSPDSPGPSPHKLIGAAGMLPEPLHRSVYLRRCLPNLTGP
jgi:hypothetical protein